MIVIPAVDIKGGKCVRLFQGRMDRETVYSADPAAMAVRWQRAGACYLHVVDLDGAFTGAPQNLDAVREILSHVTIPVEFGGGLRGMGIVRQVLKMGVDRVVLGTAAVRDRDFLRAAVGEFGRQVFVGLDARAGRLSVEGWTKDSGLTPTELVRDLEEIGVGGLVCTDIARDGALSGPNMSMLSDILGTARTRVIASGGISSAEHIRMLGMLCGGRLYGVIIGKALYERVLTLEDALVAAGGPPASDWG